MVDGFDEAAAQREAFRALNGQFGAVPLHPPEVVLHVNTAPAEVAEQHRMMLATREVMSRALVDEIDAAMPAEADFVNYEMAENGSHLIVREAVGRYGDELDKEPFAHIDEILLQLGQPYADFDDTFVLNSDGEYGWDREQPYSAERDADARQAGELARAQWRQAAIAQQRAAIQAIWPLVAPAVDSLDFSWDTGGQCMRLAAVIHSDGRTEVSGDTWSRVNDLAAYLTEPRFAPLLRNDLSGLYRLSRGI